MELVSGSKVSQLTCGSMWSRPERDSLPHSCVTGHSLEHLDASPVRKSAVRLMAGFLKTHPLDAVPIKELGRAYFSPTVSGWAQAQSDIDVEMSKAMLGQESSSKALHSAAVKVDHDIATAG